MARRKKIDEIGSDVPEQAQEPVDGLAGVNLQSSVDGETFVDTDETETVSFKVNKKTRKLHNPRAKTVENLKSVNEANPELTPGFGEIKVDGAMVPDFMVNAVYQLIGGVEQWIFARKYGPEIASVMAYRPQDIAVLSEPTKEVLAKYLPKLGKYQEETALIMALASIHIGKVQMMNAMLAKQQESRPDVTTISQAPSTETTQ